MDCELLFYKLLCNNVTGKMCSALRSLYSNTTSCIRLNNIFTAWFPVTSGVRQGDVLSPTLFSIFVKDFATGIKDMNVGLPIGDEQISTLLYADDIVLLAENEDNLQKLLDFMQIKVV